MRDFGRSGGLQEATIDAVSDRSTGDCAETVPIGAGQWRRARLRLQVPFSLTGPDCRSCADRGQAAGIEAECPSAPEPPADAGGRSLEGSRMSFARQGLIIAVLAVLALGGWWAADRYSLLQATYDGEAAGRRGPGGPGGGPGMAAGLPVIAEPVAMRRDDIRLEAIGTGEALSGVTIYPAVAGEVTEVGFAAGQAVQKGDVLLRLDDEAERLAVELAKLEVKDAEVTLSRYRKAAPTGAVSAAEVDAARTSLDRGKLALEQAQIALRDRTLRAPFAGVVGTAEVDPGDRVTTATAITTLDDRSAIIVTFDVPEIHADHIRPGLGLRATPWSLNGRQFDGVVESVGSRIDPVSRTLPVRARVPNEGDALRPGMSFAIGIEIPGADYASVPEISVLWSREGAYVWRVGDAAALAAAENAARTRPAAASNGDRATAQAMAMLTSMPAAADVDVEFDLDDGCD